MISPYKILKSIIGFKISSYYKYCADLSKIGLRFLKQDLTFESCEWKKILNKNTLVNIVNQDIQ